jgi:hypothetical protein
MPHILKNENIELHIDSPLEGYKSSRFDWTGKITTLKFQNTLISSLENPNSEHKDLLGKGFYNEFGIDHALGYEDTEIGGWFHKIGVGLLKKIDHKYKCTKVYEVKPAQFTLTREDHKVLIRCQSETSNGYAYILDKHIELQENGFTITYNLENTGEKSIITDEYVHNFMAINNDAIGPNYELNFPFSIKPDLFEETVNPEQKVLIGEKDLKFKDTIEKEYFFSNLSGNNYENASWELKNSKSTITISETGSFKTNKVNIWGQKHVISPELFVAININPGKSTKWSRHYKIANTKL